MRQHRARTTTALTASLAIAMSSLTWFPGTAVAAASGAVIIPARPAAAREGDAVSGLVGGPGGIAYSQSLQGANGLSVTVRPTGAAHGSPGLARTISIVGDQLLGWSYGSPATLTAVSLTSGARLDLGVPATSLDRFENDYRSLPQGTGTGWVDARTVAGGTVDALVLHSTVGAPDRVFPLPVAGVTSIGPATADDRGVAVQLTNSATPGGTNTYYLDFSGGQWTMLSWPVSNVAFSPNFLAWAANGTLYRVPRSDLTATPETRSVPTDTGEVAITDTATAWTVEPGLPYPGTGPFTLFTAAEPASTPGVAVPQSPDSAWDTRVVALGGNDFAGGFGQGPQGPGVYRVSAGSAALGDQIDPSGGTPVPVQESTGQQYSISPGGRTATVQSVTTRGGAIVLGRSRAIAAPPGRIITLLAVDGPRVAMVTRAGKTTTLTVTGVRPKPWVVPVPPSTYAIAFSGHRLLVSDEQDEPDAAFKGRSRLLDLALAGTHWTTVPDISAISGRWLVYEVNNGSVWLRDLDQPRTHDKQLAPARPGDDTRGDHGQVNITGNWVTWTDWGIWDAEAASGAYRLSTGTALDRPNVRSVLADGLAAYVDDQLAVHLVDLGSGTDTTVPGALSQGDLSISNEVLAYLDVDNDTVLVPVAALLRAAPKAVVVGGDTGVRAAAVSPAKPLLATYEVSRPLTTWTFEVRSKKGVVVFRSRGSAPTGWLRVAWNGRGARNKRLAAGTYTWRLTGKGPAGSLTTSTGRGTLHGTARI